MKKSNTQVNTFSMVLCALFSALIVVGAFIKIPTPMVPITLQAEFVILAGLMLGSKLGAASAGIYLTVGLLGLPVFTQGGGIGYVFQPTFGYVIGFVFGAYLAGLVVEKAKKSTYAVYFLACLAGIGAIYATGLIYVYLIKRFYLNVEIGLWVLLLNYFLLTLPGDIILCAGGALLVKRLKPITAKYFALKKVVD